MNNGNSQGGDSYQQKTLDRLDQLVKKRVFAHRSRVVQEVVEEKLNRLDRTRLAEECARLDSVAEQAIAEEGLSEEVSQWPEY